MLQCEAFQPFHIFRAALLRPDLFRQYQAVRGMCTLREGILSACLQFFQSVLANRFQHREARFSLRLLNLLHQTLVHHGRYAVEQVQIEIALRVTHGFHTFQIASAHEHRQSPEKLLLGRA